MTSLDRRLPPGFLEEALRADARTGLNPKAAEPKSLPPKWFYDAQGSALFDKITELPEYYPTRAEREILRASAAEIAAQTGARTLIELGSGSSDKTRLLLDALRDAGTLRCYVPVDVSEPALAAAGKALSAEYPGLDVRAVVSDFEERLGFPADGEAPAPRLVAFLGSTIGNLEPGQRAAFLARVRDQLRPGDFFLLGTDLVKDPATLVAAYDDEAGVTAEFNKNVLAVLNAELGADFDLDAFEHVAVWNADAEWIEMRLRSCMAQTVRLPGIGLTVEFADGEEMRTEVSAKFRREGVAGELAAAGFAMRSWWTDMADQFGLSLSMSAPSLPAPSLPALSLPALSLPALVVTERGDELLEPVRAQPGADRFERRLDPADTPVAAVHASRPGGLAPRAEALLQADGHGVAGLLADDLADLGLDRKLVGAIAQGHERALERVAVNGPPHLDQAPGPEELHRLRPDQVRPAALGLAAHQGGGEFLVHLCLHAGKTAARGRIHRSGRGRARPP